VEQEGSCIKQKKYPVKPPAQNIKIKYPNL